MMSEHSIDFCSMKSPDRADGTREHAQERREVARGTVCEMPLRGDHERRPFKTGGIVFNEHTEEDGARARCGVCVLIAVIC